METRTSGGRTVKKVLPAVARSHFSAIIWVSWARDCAGNYCPVSRGTGECCDTAWNCECSGRVESLITEGGRVWSFL